MIFQLLVDEIVGDNYGNGLHLVTKELPEVRSNSKRYRYCERFLSPHWKEMSN